MKWGMNTILSVGFGMGTICPLAGRRWVISFARYPAARSWVISFSFMVEATHLPPAPDMFSCAEKTWTRVLELEGERVGKGGRRHG